jgi:hypothetical protein
MARPNKRMRAKIAAFKALQANARLNDDSHLLQRGSPRYNGLSKLNTIGLTSLHLSSSGLGHAKLDRHTCKRWSTN